MVFGSVIGKEFPFRWAIWQRRNVAAYVAEAFKVPGLVITMDIEALPQIGPCDR